jgi:hypothetical protein
MKKVLLLAGALMLLPMGAANAIPCPGDVSDTLSIANGVTATICEGTEQSSVLIPGFTAANTSTLVVLTDEQTTISSPDPVTHLVTITGASDFVQAFPASESTPPSIELTSDGDAGGLSTVVMQGSFVAIAETGGPQDLSQYFGFAANSGQVVVRSDTEPEPPTLPIFLTGLGLMGLLLWRSKRSLTA